MFQFSGASVENHKTTNGSVWIYLSSGNLYTGRRVCVRKDIIAGKKKLAPNAFCEFQIRLFYVRFLPLLLP
jgi:hypothetical protein